MSPADPAPAPAPRRVHEARARIAVAAPDMPSSREIAPYLERIDRSGWCSDFGPLLSEFEARLQARFAPGTHVVTTANGTLALTLLLEAMGLPRGALCALPSWTFVATAHAVRMAGLVPWFVDVDPVEGELTPGGLTAQLAAAPGPVVAAIPIAVMGKPLAAAAWRGFQDATGIRVLIDAAAGFDTAREAPVPVMVSLHATKALGIGEGAFIATEGEDLAQRFRAMTNFGFLGDRISRHVATNAKLSEYAAAVGLAALDGWPERRSRYLAVGRRLRMALADEPRISFQDGWGVDWISSTCIIRVGQGPLDAIEVALAASGVDIRRWWGAGCHRAPAFRDCPSADLAVTEALADSTLGLPFSAGLTGTQINAIATAVKAALDLPPQQPRSAL